MNIDSVRDLVEAKRLLAQVMASEIEQYGFGSDGTGTVEYDNAHAAYMLLVSIMEREPFINTRFSD